jgi:hypothetical protein
MSLRVISMTRDNGQAVDETFDRPSSADGERALLAALKAATADDFDHAYAERMDVERALAEASAKK